MDILPFFYGVPALTIASYLIDETREELRGEIQQVRSEIRHQQPHERTQRVVTNLFREGMRENFK